MTNIKFTKILTTAFILAASFSQAAISATSTCAENEANCWSCGSDCAARYDSSTNSLTFSGSRMDKYYGHEGYENPWYKEIPSHNFTNIIIEENMQTIGSFMFSGITATNVSIPSTLENMDGYTFHRLYTDNIIIPETTKNISSLAFHCAGVQKTIIPDEAEIGNISTYGVPGIIYCTVKNIAKCGSNALLYEKDGDNYIAYDANGKIDKIFGSWEDFAGNKDVISGSYAKKDENGNILATYSGNGAVLSEYSYAADGSVYIRDANGKLIGAKKTSPFTPAEAAALIKKGNNNIIKMTFK